MANWTIEERRQIWNKGQVVPGYDPTMWRKDQCGAFIKWDKIDLTDIIMVGR